MSTFREFESADVFIVGAVGRPGARTFFLQMGDASDLVSLKCEKEQVAALAAFLRKTLADAPAVTRTNAARPVFNEPIEVAFSLGSVGLAYDRRDDHIVLQFDEFSNDTDTDDETEDTFEDADNGRVRLRISRSQATMFCEAAELVVRSGRPPCEFCGLPMNLDGHACPKMN